MAETVKIQKGYVRLYSPTGGSDYVDAREDQADRYLNNGWTKTKKRAKPADQENNV